MKSKLLFPLALCGAAFVLAPLAHAQDPSPSPSVTGTDAGPAKWAHHGPAGAGMLKRLTTQLSLTDDQQASLKPVLETSGSDMQAIRQDTTLSREDKMAKMKEARESVNAKITAVLTPDQQAKFTAIQEKMRNRRRGPGASPSPSASADASASPSATP